VAYKLACDEKIQQDGNVRLQAEVAGMIAQAQATQIKTSKAGVCFAAQAPCHLSLSFPRRGMPSRTTPLCTLHFNGDGCMTACRAACCSLRTSYAIARAASGSP
jgi:hypothetical protein